MCVSFRENHGCGLVTITRWPPVRFKRTVRADDLYHLRNDTTVRKHHIQLVTGGWLTGAADEPNAAPGPETPVPTIRLGPTIRRL